MGAIKLTNYSTQEIRKSTLARAFAVPARISILKTLVNKEFVPGEVFVDLLKLSQPTVHHHLSLLRDTGLVKGDFIGSNYLWSLSLKDEKELELLTWFIAEGENEMDENKSADS